MIVRIQLIRDNGSVVQQIEGKAEHNLVYEMPVSLGHLITEDGVHLAGFQYVPHVLSDIAWADDEANLPINAWWTGGF